MPDDFNALSEFRKRYPDSKLSDSDVYMGLAKPDNFRAAFPEYSSLDDTTIGRNVAAEAGKVDTGKPWYQQTWEGLKGMGSSMLQNIETGGKSGQEAFLNSGKQRTQDAAARQAEGRSPLYRAAASTLEGSGLFNPRPMEEAANAGHTGEVAGHAVAAALPFVAPAVMEGAGWAGRGIREMAMDAPEVAVQKAMVSPKSTDAAQAQADAAGAKPFLNAPKDLETLQKNLPAAKTEVGKPYWDNIINDPVKGAQIVNGPDGPISLKDLEAERQKVSANLKTLKESRPTDRQEILQKAGSVKELADREQAIIGALDPALEAHGINPKLIRKTYGNLLGIEDTFQGRNTLTEGKPSGLGKIGDADITKLKTYFTGANLPEGVKDILAGRGWFTQKPTDVNVREGFRDPGPKPEFTRSGVGPARQLGSGSIVTPQPGATPVESAPPNVFAGSRAERLGLLLPEKASVTPQIATGWVEPAAPGAVSHGEMPPTGPSSAPGVEPQPSGAANYRVVRDPATGQMKKQYLSTSGGKVVRDEQPAPAAPVPLERDPATGRMLPRGQKAANKFAIQSNPAEVTNVDTAIRDDKPFDREEYNNWIKNVSENQRKIAAKEPKLAKGELDPSWGKIVEHVIKPDSFGPGIDDETAITDKGAVLGRIANGKWEYSSSSEIAPETWRRLHLAHGWKDTSKIIDTIPIKTMLREPETEVANYAKTKLGEQAAGQEVTNNEVGFQEKLEDAIVNSGADKNFAARRAKQLADQVQGKGNYSGIERRSSKTIVDNYLEKYGERRKK